MTTLRKVGLDEVERRLAALDASEGPGTTEGAPAAADPTPTISGVRLRLRRSVVLATTFDPTQLRVGREDLAAEDLSTFLSEDCEAVRRPASWTWRLGGAVRAEALRALSPSERKALLADEKQNAPETDLPRLAAAMLLRGRVNVAGLDQPMLRALLIALDWLEAIEPNRPERATIQDRLAILEVQRPLRMLTSGYFVGRAVELKRIQQHLLNGRVRPAGPLIVTGTGGVGKSTLIAKAVLDAWDGKQRLNATYFTFDRADLRADNPATLLAEAARQLAASSRGSTRDAAERFVERVRATDLQYGTERRSRANVARSKGASLSVGRSDLAKLASDYARLARRQPGHIVWILDTFEVAQRVGPDGLRELAWLLDELDRVVGLRWRVLISGRGTVRGFGGEEMHLEGLDPLNARSLLVHQLKGTKLAAKVIDSVVAQIGTNPLSIRLVGELLRLEAKDGASSSTTNMQRLVFRAEKGQIQGVLYRRILDRLAGEDIKKMAKPGLVVRSIDAEVVRKVLAKPCGLGRLTVAEATDLIERLGREASLGEPAEPGVFRYREDIRGLMLPLLERESPGQVQAIHEAAFNFHAGRWRKTKSRADKVEELYHRLALGQDEATLGKAWDQEAAQGLQSSMEELPVGSQVYLADRLGWTVDPKLLKEAGDLSWANQTALEVRALLDMGDATSALDRARARKGPAVRALMDPLIIESLAVLRRDAEAITQANRTLGWAASAAAWPTYIEVAVLGARIAEDAGEWTKAKRLLNDARQAAEDTEDRILHLAAGVALLRIHRRSKVRHTKASKAFREEVLAEGRGMTSAERRANPTVVSGLAAEFGAEAPDLVAAATDLVGVDLTTAAGEALIRSLSSEDRQAFNRYAREEASSETGPATAPPEDPEDEDLGWLSEGTSTEQSSVVGEFLKSDRPSGTWTDAVSNAFRHDADSRAF